MATNSKMHELANPKEEFIIRMQGCFMYFKGRGAAGLQRLELQITGLSLRLLGCFPQDIGFIFFFFLSFHEVFSFIGSVNK